MARKKRKIDHHATLSLAWLSHKLARSCKMTLSLVLDAGLDDLDCSSISIICHIVKRRIGMLGPQTSQLPLLQVALKLRASGKRERGFLLYFSRSEERRVGKGC